MRSMRIKVSEEGLLQLMQLANGLGITVRHAGSLVMLAGLQAMSFRQSLVSEDATTMYFDQFGKPIEADRVYGIGRTETKCVLHETQYDSEIDEIVIRKRGSTAPFGRLDETDLAADFFFLVEPKTLSAYQSDPRDEESTDDAGLGKFLEDQLANIVLDQNKTLCREKLICARLGVSVADGSDLADMVCRFVRDPDTVSVGDLVRLKSQSCQSVS
jgi:hypothetical protein